MFLFLDMSATALSRAMAREPWSREYFEILREYKKKRELWILIKVNKENIDSGVSKNSVSWKVSGFFRNVVFKKSLVITEKKFNIMEKNLKYI